MVINVPSAMRFKSFLPLFVLCIATAGIGQVESGTAVFALGTQHEAIVAMDTLVKFPLQNAVVPNTCKLQQHGNTLLAMNGVEPTDGQINFDSSRFDSDFESISNLDGLAKAVREWALMSRDFFEQLAIDHPEAFVSNGEVNPHDTGSFANALFLTTDFDSNTLFLAVSFSLLPSPAPNGHRILVMATTTIPDDAFYKPGKFIFAAARGGSVYYELKDRKSARAKNNQRILGRLYAASTTKEKTRALDDAIKLTAKWYKEDVQTPVDIAEVSNHKVIWLQRNHACANGPSRLN